ncbi:alpha/beta hydrolase [Streptomyces daqingensis]|uniref:Alpha/beta hydrolase n=1 Tax=Streptomyces daqingensis TaxID=1472640 RepID=A0ABQ2MDI0_9ACTN|nr:alpha/beta hydrolase [Streptomyces daqingensis]GGO50056.1 alpha/beta hydrolase [Streptomyces daqingensis]
MSKPPFLVLPPVARAYRLATARGEFAVHDAGRPRLGTALLLPGFTGSKEDFIALLEPLAGAGFRAVAVDQRGQYETDGPRTEAAYAREELALDALALAEALQQDDSVALHGSDSDSDSATVNSPDDGRSGGTRGPVHLLGHSLGGLIAREAVLRDRTPFASLTLMSSGPAAVSATQQHRLKLLLGALPVMTAEEIWQAMRELDPVEAADESTPPEVAGFMHERWLAHVPEQLCATAQQLIAEPDRVGELAAAVSASGPDRPALPVHVLSGSVDYAWPVPLIDDMAVRLGAVRTVVQGAGHSPNAERPGETAQALADFWSGAPG